jgi:hypothetical protein
MNAAGSTTVTVNTSLFAAGDTLVIQNIGAGVTTVTAGTATVSSAGPLTIPQYGSGTLYFTSAGVSLWFPSAGPAASSGLTLISKQTVSATTQVNLTGVFSTTYDNYTVRWTNLTMPNDVSVRFGTSGTPDTAATYNRNDVQQYYGTLAGATGLNATAITVNGTNDTTAGGLFLDISSPFLSVPTTLTASATGRDGTTNNGYWAVGTKVTNTSYTDLVFRTTGSNFSGTVYIYGYANS